MDLNRKFKKGDIVISPLLHHTVVVKDGMGEDIKSTTRPCVLYYTVTDVTPLGVTLCHRYVHYFDNDQIVPWDDVPGQTGNITELHPGDKRYEKCTVINREVNSTEQIIDFMLFTGLGYRPKVKDKGN